MREPQAAQNARTSNQDRIAEAVEREIEVLRELRPALSSRLDRAAALLVGQLSLPPHSRPLKVRIGADGQPRFLVASLASPGVVYQVDVNSFSCSCPDYHRRNQACKHALAAYVLKRVAREARPRKGCAACYGGWVYLGEEVLDPATGEIAEAINPVRCTRCSGGLSHDDVRLWLESQRWIFAKSRATNPHEYCLRREAGDEATFERIVQFIREYGSPYPWWGKQYQQYVAGDHVYWTMGSPIPETVLINRKSLERVRLDQLENRGGGGIVWPWLHTDIEAEREELHRQEAGQEELGEGAS